MILSISIMFLIMVQAGMLGLLSNTVIFPLFVVVLAATLFARPLQLRFPLAIKILFPITLVGYFSYRAMAIYYGNEELGRNEFIFPIWITVPLAECFLLGQIFESMKERTKRDSLINFCMLAMATLVCVCSRHAAATDRALIFLGTVIGITLICVVFQYSSRPQSRKVRQSNRFVVRRGTLITVTMMLVGIGTWYLSGFLRNNIEGFQEWWFKNISRQMAGLVQSEVRFSADATLNNITNLKKSNPNSIALRIYSNTPPGYLRGQAYDRLVGNKWRGGRGLRLFSSIERPSSFSDTGKPYFRLRTGQSPDDFKEFRIENKEINFIFTPLQATVVSGNLTGSNGKIGITKHRVLSRAPSNASSYQVYCERERRPVESSEILEMFSECLTVPETLTNRNAIETLANQVTRNQTSDLGKITAVETYFQDNYRYSLDQKAFPSNRDKLTYFILEKPPAHCEFFASAAVVLLRFNGIPARYVTGFATDEMDSEQDYYVARNRDAHAWAEAYDSNAKKWVIVEATPGTEYPKDLWAGEDEDDDSEGMNANLNNSESSRFQISFFLQSIVIRSREFFLWLGQLVRGPLNATLLILLIGGSIYRFWWLPRSRFFRNSRYHQLEAERKKVERQLARLNWRRDENESMHQFKRRIQDGMDESSAEKLKPLLDWMTQYEKVRFGDQTGELPIPSAPALSV